ncbi:transcription factor JunD-like [Hyla sarda]|uniref:transcription factor JunD-like n=1 Tax=Hyla sarda TaxID=327740 RepID=UPI0024C2B2DD|nr:transcription factor JunD-like [Hyla sarda]
MPVDMGMSFYHDDLNVCLVSFPHSSTSSRMMNKDMNLNISDEVLSHIKPYHLEGNGLINSTDMGLMNLASLDLERLIHSNSMATASPNSSHCLYSKMSIMEQEFSHGFVRALEDLNKPNHPNNSMEISSGSIGATVHSSEPSYTSVYVTPNNYNGNEVVGTTANYHLDPISYPHLPMNMEQQSTYPTHTLHAVKDEPQTVPEVTSLGDSPPLSPINMDNQERIKAERKKLRNRIAASRCRKRKLERISRLEEKVKNLKTQNLDLVSTASVLRKQVAQLKQKVMSHVNSGCQLLPYHVQAY